MPHQCTECEQVYENGDEAILEGCDCGGNQFQFIPASAVPAETEDDSTPATEPAASRPDSTPAAETGESSSGRSAVDAADDDDGLGDIIVAETQSEESDAQADARNSTVSDAELANRRRQRRQEIAERKDKDPEEVSLEETIPGDVSLEAMREELNEQFGSIQILEPGHYRLDLRELAESKDHIIELQEDGRYLVRTVATVASEEADN